jgi:uncharacterized membrane-anchored protein
MKAGSLALLVSSLGCMSQQVQADSVVSYMVNKVIENSLDAPITAQTEVEGSEEMTEFVESLRSPISFKTIDDFNAERAANTDENQLWIWIKAHNWIFFTFMFVIGAFVCFVGQKLFRPVVFLLVMTSVTGFGMYLSYTTVFVDSHQEWLAWTMFSVFLLLGLGLGVCMVKLLPVAIFFVAAFAGFCLGVSLCDGFLSLFFEVSAVVYWVFIAIFALTCGLMVACYEQQILILATAYAGAYMMVRATGLVAPGYPIGGNTEGGNYSFVYFMAMVLLTALGITAQWKVKQRDEANEHPYQQIRRRRG